MTVHVLPVRLTPSERVRYQRWWIEKSGLTRSELVCLALDMGAEPSFGETLRLVPGGQPRSDEAQRASRSSAADPAA